MNCSQEFHPEQKFYTQNPREQYNRIRKLENVKLNLLNFINIFSKKDWKEGIQVDALRINFQKYFHIPIHKQGLGQIKEVKYSHTKFGKNKMILMIH